MSLAERYMEETDQTLTGTYTGGIYYTPQYVAWLEQRLNAAEECITLAGGYHSRTEREVEIEQALDETPFDCRDPADHAIDYLLKLVDAGRNRVHKAEDRAETLERAIKTHRSQKADDRCIEDDDRLYEALGDGIKCDRRVGDPLAMAANCIRFIQNRCQGGGWPSYAELEAEVKRLEVVLAGRCACRFDRGQLMEECHYHRSRREDKS